MSLIGAESHCKLTRVSVINKEKYHMNNSDLFVKRRLNELTKKGFLATVM
ncbi:hypothetical protein [Liquorilactobacillus uvarum]|nr:hypothetical protein [Liquorilactobacillus uvarum]